MHDDDIIDERLRKALARGEALGFTGVFLIGFAERELGLMQRWANRRVPTGPVAKADFLPWGGRFSKKGTTP